MNGRDTAGSTTGSIGPTSGGPGAGKHGAKKEMLDDRELA